MSLSPLCGLELSRPPKRGKSESESTTAAPNFSSLSLDDIRPTTQTEMETHSNSELLLLILVCKKEGK